MQYYSQDGEDIFLHQNIFKNKSNGFYVDIGAHHPTRFSNTKFFYDMGWTGINIEPIPNSMAVFNRERPKDINLEIAISNEYKRLNFYMFNEPALNSLSKELSEERHNANDSYKIIEIKEIDAVPLSSVLDEHIKKEQSIDFMSIDVEDYELNVLESNNWKKYSPDILIVEILDISSEKELKKSSVHNCIINLGYELIHICKHFSKIYRKIQMKK